MTKAQIEARMKEREEFIVSILKEDPKSTLTGKSIEDACDITPGNRSVYMRKLMKKYPQIRNVGSLEAEYKWVEDTPVKIKNHEGYPDPTAQKAIDAVCNPVEIPEIGTNLKPKRESYSSVYRKQFDPTPGEIWSASESNGKSVKVIVVGVKNDVVQLIKCQPADEDIYGLGESKFAIMINDRRYVWDPSRLTFKPLRYLERRTKIFDLDLLKDVRSRISDILGIKPPKVEIREKIVEVPVEKIVYKEKEETIPENFADTRTAEIAILTEQRDIWKTVALKLLEGRA